MTECKVRSAIFDGRVSVLNLWPKTGFTHQLRYQCALHTFPLIRDKKYGNFSQSRAFFKDTTAASSIPSLRESNTTVQRSGSVRTVRSSSEGTIVLKK